MYAQDYDEVMMIYRQQPYYFPTRLAGDFNWYDDAAGGLSYTWPTVLYPYVMNAQVFVCPSAANNTCWRVSYGVPISASQPAAGGGHSLINLFASAQMMSSFRRPAETCMISEKGGGAPQYLMSTNHYACRDSHNESGNIAYLDGHVKLQRFERSSLVAYGWGAPVAGYECHMPVAAVYNPFGSAGL